MRILLRKKWIILLMFLSFLALYTITIIRIEAYINHRLDNKVSTFLAFEDFNLQSLAPEKENVTVALLFIPSKQQSQQQKQQQNHHQKKELTSTSITSFNKDPKKCVFKKHYLYPHCESKITYLKSFWTQDCFQKHGVDGSDCTILDFLTKIEPYCAPLEKPKEEEQITHATLNFDLEGLLKLIPGNSFRWMRERATGAWSDWVAAGHYFKQRNQKYRRKKVALFMGSMGFQPFIMEMAGKGGPLGELVQWTDIICGLYVLGYDINVYLNETHMNLDMPAKDGCASPISETTKYPEVIYTDSNGVISVMKSIGPGTAGRYRCRYRILDSFGTWPEYNDPTYPFDIPGGRSPWANMNLLPLQYFTLYPHTHDNHFLGFVVGSNKVNEQRSQVKKQNNKKDKALLYAKILSYCKSEENRRFLKIVSEYFQIEATAIANAQGFDYIHNHGPVSGAKVRQLLQEAKVFIGCGFPFEGPGPLEAMAAGTPFIQPKFAVPKNKMNDDFFKQKPTLRLLTSQSPYMEEFVGEPYAYTIDVKNEKILRQTLQKIKAMQPLPPKIPKEFTNEGMLERLHVFTEHMDFCDVYKARWPPVSHMRVLVSELGQSCKDVCMTNGLVCERSFFNDINNQQHIEKRSKITCSSIKSVFFLHAPSYDSIRNTCYIQQNTQLFSCSHIANDVRQICPCRDYEEGQSALCKDCL